MLTIFTVPKAFSGHTGVIQDNAIRSWLSLKPKPEVILLGYDAGTAEAAARFGVRHVADVVCNEYGTPLLNSIFSIAQDGAQYPVLCYVNADIILLSDFIKAVQQIRMSSFMMAGQRWDLDVREPLGFCNPDWEAGLRARVAAEGKQHPPTGIDYFVFNRGLYRDIPPFAIGRTYWDTWLIYQARAMKAPVIDASRAVMAIHQNHDYGHQTAGYDGVWKGPESKRNMELMNGTEHAFTLEYATMLIMPGGMKRALSLRHLYFRLEALPVLTAHLRWLVRPMKSLTRLIVRIRSAFRHG